MTTEIKLGIEHEARSGLLMRILEAKLKNTDLPISELMQEYEDAMPFGGVQSEQAREQLEKGIQRRLKQNDESSLKGFYQFAFKGDNTDHDELEEELARMDAVRSVAKLPVSLTEVLQDPRLLAPLMQLIESHPDHVLCHLSEEIDDRESTHPNVSRRLLYLWRNQQAIVAGGGRDCIPAHL